MALAGDDDAGLDTGCGFCRFDAGGDAGEIGVGAEADAIAMIGRDDDLAVDRIDGREFPQIGLGQECVVLLRAEECGHAVVSLDELGEIGPGVGTVAHEGLRVYAIFLRLGQRQRRRCRDGRRGATAEPG